MFGYAFDGCCSEPPPISEDSSISSGSTAELEQCLQIYSHDQQTHTLASNVSHKYQNCMQKGLLFVVHNKAICSKLI